MLSLIPPSRHSRPSSSFPRRRESKNRAEILDSRLRGSDGVIRIDWTQPETVVFIFGLTLKDGE